MARSVVAVTGINGHTLNLPSWGKALWQDPNDGNLILLFASGNSEVDFVWSKDSGNSWSLPQFAFSVDNFSVHDNFDTAMDPGGNLHHANRWNNSGCYGVLGKNYTNGVWQQSGISDRGFVAVVDAGQAKGFNGSIEIHGSVGISDVAGPHPAVRIAARDSNYRVNQWWVPNPYDVFPRLDTIGSHSTVHPAGPSGGYPIWSLAGPFGRQLIWSLDATGIIQVGRSISTYSKRIIPVKDPNTTSFSSSSLEASGYFSRVPMGPSMAHIRTNSHAGPTGDRRLDSQELLLLTSKHNGFIGVDVIAIGVEGNMVDGVLDSDFNVHNVMCRIPSLGCYTDYGNLSRSPNGVSVNNQNEIRGNIFSRTSASGTLVDMSWGEEDGTVHMYFLISEDAGEQNISRIKVNTVRNWPGGTIDGDFYGPTLPSYNFSSLSHTISGVHSWAPAGREYTGGSGLFLTWNNFKALRHPARQFEGWPKQEAVVTQGSGLDGAVRLVFWDYAQSIDGIDGNMQLPTYTQWRTGTSGVNAAFSGITNAVGLTAAEIDALLDDNAGTSASVSNGDSFIAVFNTQQTFHRFELVWLDLGPNMFEINIDASLDGVIYRRVGTIPEGHATTQLIKFSSEYDVRDVDLNGTINYLLTPFVAKFVKVSFGGVGVGTRTIREIRLYGAHNTAGGWETEGSTKVFFTPTPISRGRVETFSSTREGELPPHWRTYGDFTWFVRASGTLSDDTQSGYVNNASIYFGTSNGRDDGFAVRTSPTEANPVTITSGVLEVDINVQENELAYDEVTVGRTISFDIRYDTVIQPPLVTSSDHDDNIIFQLVTPTGTLSVEYPARFPIDEEEFCGTTACSTYSKYRTIAPTGTSTLRWIYLRGLEPLPGVVDDEASAWIDNVEGVGQISQAAIAGFLQGSAFSSTESEGGGGGASGVFGYMAKLIASSGKLIAGYMNSDTALISGSINAWMSGVEFASGGIHGWMYGKAADEIYGYMEGTNLNNYVNAYLCNSGVSGVILGYLANLANEQVMGYMQTVSGSIGDIYGFVKTMNFTTVNAYVKAPELITSGVNAFLQAKGDQSTVYAYMLASGIPTMSTNAYLFNNGVSGAIYAVIIPGERSIVAGYLVGAEVMPGVINAYTSGVGFSSGSINAYLFGISGVASGSINSYMVGSELPIDDINAYLIGLDDNCDFPLTPLPSFTIPSGNFFL